MDEWMNTEGMNDGHTVETGKWSLLSVLGLTLALVWDMDWLRDEGIDKSGAVN